MGLLKQSAAYNRMVLMTLATDHVTGAADLTLTITASKAGGAFASITPEVTERGNGWYELALLIAHTDTLGDFCMHITGAAADPTDTHDQVGNFPADVQKWLGTTPAALSTLDDTAAAIWANNNTRSDVLDKLENMIATDGGSGNSFYTEPALTNVPSAQGVGFSHILHIGDPNVAPANLTFRVGDGGITIQEVLRYADGTPIDLTGKTVTLSLYAAAGGSALWSHAGTIDWAQGGVAHYKLTSADLSVPGSYYRRWKVTTGAGLTLNYPEDVQLSVLIQP